MLQHFSTYIKNIAIFIIFMSFVGMIIPQSKYKGYINLVMGFVLIFLVLSPLQSIMGGFTGDIGSAVTRMQNSLELNIMAKGLDVYDEAQKELVINEFKAQINAQIKSRMDKDPKFAYLSSEIEVDRGENFGAITGITLAVTEKPPDNTEKAFIRIEPVTIDTISVFAPKAQNAEPEPSAEIESIKKSLSDFYNLPISNIHVTIR